MGPVGAKRSSILSVDQFCDTRMPSGSTERPTGVPGLSGSMLAGVGGVAGGSIDDLRREGGDAVDDRRDEVSGDGEFLERADDVAGDGVEVALLDAKVGVRFVHGGAGVNGGTA